MSVGEYSAGKLFVGEYSGHGCNPVSRRSHHRKKVRIGGLGKRGLGLAAPTSPPVHRRGRVLHSGRRQGRDYNNNKVYSRHLGIIQ